MSGRGREATLPSWMAPNAQPPGRPGQPPGAPAFGGMASGPTPPGWPAAPDASGQAPPAQNPSSQGGPPHGFLGPPGSGPPQQPSFMQGPPGHHLQPPSAPASAQGAPGHFPGTPGGTQVQQQHGGAPAGPPGHPPGQLMRPPMNPGMQPPAGAPGLFPGPPNMQPPPMMPPLMGLPPGAMPPPMHGAPPGAFGAMMGAPPGMGMPPMGMPPPGMLPVRPGMLPPGAGMPPQFPGMAPPQHQQQQQQRQAAPQQPGQPGAAPATQAAPATKSAWTEHTAPDGRKYYYNQSTKQSSWEKPAELLSSQEKAEAVPWKEYTAPDGRKYYYNKDTKESKWTMPDELKKAKGIPTSAPPGPTANDPANDADKKDAVAAGNNRAKMPESKGTPEPAAAETPTSTRASAGEPKYQYATKAEAKDAFKELLASVNCCADWNWEHALKLIVNDPRYGALKSLGEKKACFNEYIQQRRNEEKEEERKRIKQAREDFLTMIVQSTELKLTHSYRRAKEIFENDPCWKAVPERERDDLFHEGLKEKDKKEKEERRAEKQRKCAAFRTLLDSFSIKLGAEWRKVVKKLEGEDVFEELEKVDRLEVFQEYQKDLERREREEKEKEKELRRREDRRARDDFKELLAKHRAQGLINVKTRWREYSHHVVGEEEYKAMERTSAGSRPKELFEYLIEDLEKEYEAAKGVIKELMREAAVEVTSTSTFDDFFSQLERVDRKSRSSEGKEEGHADDKEEEPKKEDSKLDRIDADLRLMYFEELVGRAKLREAEEAERKKRAQDKFASMLRHVRKLDAETTWEQFSSDYDREPEFKALGAEDARPIFDEFVAKLKRKAEKRRKGSDDDGSDGSRERTRRRSSRAEDSDDESQRKHKKKSSRKHDRSDDDDDEDRKSRKRKHKDKSRRDRDKERSRSRSRQQDDAVDAATPVNGSVDRSE